MFNPVDPVTWPPVEGAPGAATVPIAAARSALREALQSEASWRAQRAEEYPEDLRNTRAADIAAEAADRVQGLASTDVRLVTIAKLMGVVGIDVAMLGPSASRAGFGGVPTDVEEYVTFVVGEALAEHNEVLSEANRHLA